MNDGEKTQDLAILLHREISGDYCPLHSKCPNHLEDTPDCCFQNYQDCPLYRTEVKREVTSSPH